MLESRDIDVTRITMCNIYANKKILQIQHPGQMAECMFFRNKINCDQRLTDFQWLWRQVKVTLTLYPGHESGEGSSPSLFIKFFSFPWEISLFGSCNDGVMI